MTRENFTMSYAAQCVRVEKKEKALKVLAATRPVRSRGETLNGAILEVEFTAPHPADAFRRESGSCPAFRHLRGKCESDHH